MIPQNDDDVPTQIDVIVDPSEGEPIQFRGVEVKGLAKSILFFALVFALGGLIAGFGAKTWTVLYVGLGLFALGIVVMLVVGAIEKRRNGGG